MYGFWKPKMRSFGIFLLALLATVSLARAGTLTPSTSPAATSYTLSDLYTRLTTNATATSGNHSFSAPGSVAATLQDLAALYNAIPTIVSSTVVSGTSYLGITGIYNMTNLTTSTVASGTIFGVNQTGTLFGSTNAALVSASATYPGTFITANLSTSTVASGTVFGVNQTGTLYGSTSSSQVCSTATYAGTLNPATSSLGVGNTVCGVAGTLLKNLFSGTGQGITGGVQGSGGVDDYNNAGSAPSDRYAGLWTQCTSANSQCGTSTTSSDFKDESTGLIWSKPCNGAGCDSFSTSSPMTYAWATSTTNANNFSSVQSATTSAYGLCTNGDHAISGWFLPHDRQLAQAYVDGAYGNMVAAGTTTTIHWAATINGNSTATCRVVVNIGTGQLQNCLNLNTATATVRCVR